MKRQNFLRSTLCLLMALLCNVVWAEKMQPSTTLPDQGRPEHVYTMMNGHDAYANGLTAPTQTEANYGQFAFYAVDGVEGAYYIYSHTAKKWLTYTKAASYSNGKDFVKMADAKVEGAYFKVENYADDFYQIAPYNTSGPAAKYLNWYQGVGSNGNPLDGTNTLGLWQDNATKDAGSKYSFTEVIVVVRTYTIDILGGADGQTINIGGKTYKDGDTYTIEGSVSKGDITVVAPAGQFATVAIDDVNETITVAFANAVSQPATVPYEIPVLYPAQQTAVGEAKATKDGDAYTLSNNVLAASYVKMGDALYFGGSEAMDLVAGTEPFTVAFGNGDNVPASAMTLESVAFEELTGKADAVGGAEHYDGHALVANYTYTYNESTINIVWRAVLRDGSHYLRTEMELKGVDDVDMYNIIPMIYNVDTKAAGSTPAVVGNTRGAVLMSNKIFAGLETPTAYNTVGDATGEEDKWNLTTTIDPVTVESTAWVQMTEAEANQAKRVEEATGATYPNLYAFKKEGVELVAGQKVEVTLTYKEGSNKLYIGGIDLLASNGDIAAMDYHVGYTGSSHDKNTYTFIVPNTGTYAIRAIVHNKSEAINAKSELTANIYTPKEGVVINTDIVGIQGRWSRNTTLAAGETWKVASVVGLIAQDGTQANADIHKTQKRRSFLAYSERERAVPWRAMSMYLAWYELQINRNNADPGREHLDNTKAEDVLDVLAHWKSDLYDRYGIAPEVFIIDDGWDKYGEWTFHDAFPNEMRDISVKAKEMGAGIGAWLGPVGGYGASGNHRRAYWNGKGGMQLSNPDYYAAFKKAAHNLVKNQGDNYVFFKFDGISGQFSSVGPDNGDTGNENAEGIIRLEQYVREELREDIFFNTSVGTWASPFWYQITDATWRQENDHDRAGNNSTKRENWITYRDRLVYQNYVKNSPICPINTLMTHGFILTKFGPPASDERDYLTVRNELRAAFLCGSGMVEVYNDYDLMNSINGGALWADLSECIAWQKRNADVLPDAHWVGGNPWTGSAAEVYGWAAWNGTKSSLALRNGANDAQTFTFTLRSALNIPANVSGSIILRSAFGDQAALEGLTEGKAYGIDETITVTLPGSSVYGFEGVKDGSQKSVSAITLTVENEATEVMMGNTLVLRAAVNTDATFPAIAWTSSDEEVATVAGGLVKPLKAGTVTITATAKDGSNKTASMTITVTPKAVDMDALVVTDLAQLSNDKVYTLSSARAFLFYKEGANKLYSSNGTDAGSVTLDKTNPNHQFRIEKIGDNYYLYSVGAKKYVAKDGSYVATATDALTLTDVSSTNANYPWQLALGGNGMNSQDPGQTAEGIKVNSWTTTDAGNCYKIEVGVPKSYVYTVTILGDDEATVTYNEQAYENGATFETEATLKTSDFAPSVVDGKFAVVNIDANNIYVSYFANDTKFYTIRGGHGGYMSLGDGYADGSGLLLTKTDAPKDNKGLWTFVAEDGGGYKIYNYSTGLSKVIGMTGSEADARATMVAPDATTHATTFEGTFNFDGTASNIKSKGTNNWWNKRGNYLAYWATGSVVGDQGSKFFLTEADYTLYPDEYIHEISDIAGIASYSPKNPNTLWYRTSAEASGVSYPWMEYALPLGNGELGCMVFGGVFHEELQFNEKTLWSGPANAFNVGGGQRTFMNFGSMIVANNDPAIQEGVTDYVRYLDIEEGIAGVEFKNANGTKQTRKYFSSAPDQVIAGQYKSEGDDKLSLLFTLEPCSEIGAGEVVYEDGTASFTGAMTVKYAARLHVVADEGATVTTTARGIAVEGAEVVTFYLKGGTNFNGDMTVFDNYFTDETAADVDDRVKSEIEAAATKGFDAIEADHVADFRSITERMTFDLGLTTPTVDTKTLIDNYYPNNGNGTSTQNDHLFLEQLYFHYGRYLAISSNRKPIAAPNNLQGIWNDRGASSPWNSDIHTNINIQMNYWPTEITNLSDLHEPFLNFIIRGAQTEGWKNVSKTYNDNGPGWSVLTETSLYGAMSDFKTNYLVANVWYTSHLWTHYRYTQDKEFLAKAFPVMWSAAEFWFHRLIEDKGYNSATQNSGYQGTAYRFEPDGTYVAPNEYSAEQDAHDSEDGTAHAQQMISYLFENIKEAIGILGQEATGLSNEDIAKLDLYLEKTDKGLHTEIYTANTALNSGWTNPRNGVSQGDVILREWKYSPYDVSSDPGHRHMSHLMALFPMDQITPESEYFTPAVNSLKLRGDAATGWSMGWKVNLWARAQDGDHAHIIIKNALKHSTAYGTNAGAGGIYYNLFDSHAPFQIDGNFGVCSGIAEMLMQSAHGYINILPALPTVWEAKGTITGMKAIGNFTVDFNWQDGKAQQVTIVSNAGAPLKVRSTRGDIAKALVTVNGVEVAAEVDEHGIATIPCEKNDVVEIDFTQENSGGNEGGNEGGDVEVTTEDALPGDGTLRFYRLAIPVTMSAYTEDLGSSYDNVLAFWQDCEDFVNEMFIPLGMCFDVVEDQRLVKHDYFENEESDNFIYTLQANGTSYTNGLIGSDSYDVGMWVHHRDIAAENSGLSAEGGVYSSLAKGSGYAKTDKWVVAHEIGHLFGAPHTTTGEGSLMDSGGDDFFAYPSIKIIRDRAKGTASYNNVVVPNNAPQFDTDAMQKTYRIPQGACLSIDVQATDAEDHRLLYTAIGCSSANVDNIKEGGYMPHFASFVPQESNVINYQPIYTADINYDTDFYVKDGTSVPEMDPGTYALSILVNDVPAKGKYNYASLADEPFYSTYAIWEANVEIVSGTAFNAALSPAKTAYTAGEQVTVSWGVNSSYFTADSRVRISLSTDYGKTFSHVLAESVPARDGQYTVTMPNVNVGNVDVDFVTAVRQKAGGIIKVEEIGGAAYTLTTLDPSENNSFTITGGADEPKAIEATISKYEIGTFYANEAVEIPEGLTAYVAITAPEMNGTEGIITMSKIEDGIIPAHTGAVIRGEQGTYTFTESNATGTAVNGNLLVGYAGTDEYTHVALPTGATVYVLTTMKEVAAFYRKEADFKLYNHKAYLKVDGAQNVRSLAIRFEGDGSTGIENSEFTIQNSEFIYDLQGRRVLNPTKGLYIVNGKKVVIK